MFWDFQHNRIMAKQAKDKGKELSAVRIESASLEALKRISTTDTGIYWDRSTNWLIGQAVREFIERYDAAKQVAFEQELDSTAKPKKS